MNDHERYAEWDAAYVLSALAPHDRKAFEVHLGTCPRCQAAVAELMPLPGLLAYARPVDQDEIPEPPADLLDRVRARRRRRRIRPRLVLAGAAVAAAIAAAFVLGTIVPLPSSPPRETLALRPARRTCGWGSTGCSGGRASR